ncbi:MAG: exosortase A [Pseudomonadota bacterium]
MPRDHSARSGLQPVGIGVIPSVWQAPLIAFALGLILLCVVTAQEWQEMAHQWWNIDTYSHILLVPLIVAWLVALKLPQLRKSHPHPFAPGLAAMFAALALWLIGRVLGINLVAHLGAVAAVQALLVTMLGLRTAAVLALPVGFAIFLVPFGDEIIPPLQAITAKIAIALTRWSGIPASVEGVYIDTPAGLFVVAEACSGVRFLIAMVTLAVLISFTRFSGWRKRAWLMLAAVIVPVLANGVRAWGTIFIAQSQGVEFASGFDHIVYGWFFFAFLVALILAVTWRFFDRDPPEHSWSLEELRGSQLVEKAETRPANPFILLALIVGCVVLTSAADIYLATLLSS